MGRMTFKKRKEKTDQGLGWKAQAPRLFFFNVRAHVRLFFYSSYFIFGFKKMIKQIIELN
jgi:hypothetical protein